MPNHRQKKNFTLQAQPLSPMHSLFDALSKRLTLIVFEAGMGNPSTRGTVRLYSARGDFRRAHDEFLVQNKSLTQDENKTATKMTFGQNVSLCFLKFILLEPRRN